MSKIGEGIQAIKGKLRSKKLLIIITWIVLLLFLILGLMLDLTYWGLIDIGCINGFWKVVKGVLQPIGFSYTHAYSILKGSLSITITTFSLVVNMGINISGRLEQKIFGIAKNEFSVLTPQLEYKSLRKMIYWVPFLMIIFINLKWCIVGYLLLFLSLWFLIKNCKVLAESYDRSKDCEIIVNEILNRVKDEEYNDEKVLWAQRAFLGEIRIGIEKTEGWRKAGILLETFVEKVVSLDDEKCFIQSYYFFKEIFGFQDQKMKHTQSVLSVKVLFDSIYEKLSVNDYKKNIVLGAVLSSSVPQWTENEVLDFLTWFLDFVGRRKRNTTSYKGEEAHSIQIYQSGAVMLILEYWLNNHYTKQNIGLERKIIRLWDYGGKIFGKGEAISLENCLQYSETLLKYDSIKMQDCFKNLKDDYIKNRGRSYIGRLVLS